MTQGLDPRGRPLVNELYRIRGKAEIVNGQIVILPLDGAMVAHARGEILASLWAYAKITKSGRAVGSTVAFIVDLPNRGSFCAGAAYYVGPDSGMKFFEGAPIFAAEVRNEGDYGPRAEIEIAHKRADYIAAGTQVVWDVDLLHDEVVWVYRASDPDTPTIYRRGDLAEAEPAVPGWSMPVEELFR